MVIIEVEAETNFVLGQMGVETDKFEYVGVCNVRRTTASI